MDEKQSLHHRQHFNLSESAKQMLEQLTTQRYPGRQRRQSQVVEDLITEAFTKERNMATVANDMQESEGNDWLAPETREAVELARQEALRLQSPLVYPEHLLLGVIAQGNNKAAPALCNAGLDMQAIRVQAEKVFGAQYTGLSGHSDELSLSPEAQDCLDCATSLVLMTRFAHPLHVLPQHLVLVILYHERMQPFFAPFATSLKALRLQLTQGLEPALRGSINRPGFLENIRKRNQRLLTVDMSQILQMGRNPPVPANTLERPVVTLDRVVVRDEVKQALQEVVAYLKSQESRQQPTERLFRGLLLIGSSSDERKSLARAVAGEAGVQLVRVNVPSLIEQLTRFDPVGSQQMLSRVFFQQVYQLIGPIYEALHKSFERVKSAAPAVLLLEDIDAFERVNRGHEGLMHRLLTALDELDPSRPVVVIATTSQPELPHRALSYTGHFGLRIVMDTAHQGGQVT
ncbi:MAG TPA: AAA family ATPase, partial [Ktedonobacteraceae bacterium]|nr:AAA family ATPase [Ktedonobacteraceae bacterium]